MTEPVSDDVYKAFLDEMQSLENFRVSYTSLHPGANVDREDPEVRRLLDALALMTARTRIGALRNLLGTQRRLFRQYFSYLLTPMPAVAMLQAVVSGRLAEPVTLPRGTELRVTSEDSPVALFHTTQDLRIFPLQLESIETLLRSKSGFRVVLTFRTAYARNDDLGTLPIYVNHLDDYAASLTVLHHIRKHLEGTSAVFDADVDDETAGTSCAVTFGSQEDPDSLPDVGHPLQQVRQFFHNPQRELFMNVALPKGARNWKVLRLCLDLDASWPKSLRLNKDMFQLFAVEVSNLKRANAVPVAANGTQSRYAIRYPDPTAKFALHSVVGVYDVQPVGMTPLKPGLIVGGNGSFEIDEPADAAQAPQLELHFPEAFASPKKIAIDARWIQPWFSELVGGSLKVQLHSRTVDGAQFEVRGDIRPHIANPLRNDFEAMLQLLALKSKTVGLTKDDLTVLVNALGTIGSSPFRDLVPSIAEVSVTSRPQAKRSGAGLVHRYVLKLAPTDATAIPLMVAGLREIARLLAIWTPDAQVALEATFAGSDERIAIE